MERRKPSSQKTPVASPLANRRVNYSRYFVLGLFGLAALSQAKLQILEKGATIKKATDMKRYVLTQDEPARRGDLLARDGEPLARDENVSDLTIDFKKCPNTEPFWLDLSRASGIPATLLSEFAQEAADSNFKLRSRVWPKAVRQAQWTAINAVRAKWRADGVSRVATGYRTYPLTESTACLIGVIRPKFIPVPRNSPLWAAAVRQNGMPEAGKPAAADGLTGLEQTQDHILRGVDGRRVGVTDRSGQFLPMRIESETPRRDGKNITLTIDRDLQSMAAIQVKKAVEDNHAESGVAVIEDPHTGDLLAVANYPSFQPYTADGNYGSLGEHGGLNHAYMSCLEPGSMFKILTLAKALDAGVVHMSDTFSCPGEKVVVPGAKPIKCDQHAGNRAHGLIDPVHAIAKSCNIWAATWAYKIGYDPFISYLDGLGLFSKPDIGVPGAAKGLFNRNDPAKELQLANVGFGQSINCTAVSLVGAFCTLANDGKRVPPRLIEKIGDKALAPGKGVPLLTKESCQNVIKGMIAVFEDPHGTGKTLRIPGYQLAGKTGTAQKLGAHNSGHVSNFVGFVPAINPKAVILVMINKPTGAKYYGAEVAGPVFKALAQQVIRKYRLQPTEPVVNGRSVPEAIAMTESPKPGHKKKHKHAASLVAGLADDPTAID